MSLLSRGQASRWPCWHPSLCASRRETLVGTAWGPAWPHSGSVTPAPEHKQKRGQSNPTPAKPSAEEGGGGHCC